MKRTDTELNTALFFEPWIGADYKRLKELEGQVLSTEELGGFWAYPCHVLGESHYGKSQESEPGFTRYVIEKCGFTRSRCSSFFAKVLQVVANKHVSHLNREEHWQKLAFSNYIQDLLPKSRQAPSDPEWERGAAAFRSQLAITTPDILIVLGPRLWNHLPRDFGFAVEPMRLPRDMFPLPQKYGNREVVVSEAWAYVYEVAGTKRVTVAVYVAHPSGRGFDWHIAAKRVNTVRIFYSNIAVSEEVSGYGAEPVSP